MTEKSTATAHLCKLQRSCVSLWPGPYRMSRVAHAWIIAIHAIHGWPTLLLVHDCYRETVHRPQPTCCMWHRDSANTIIVQRVQQMQSQLAAGQACTQQDRPVTRHNFEGRLTSTFTHCDVSLVANLQNIDQNYVVQTEMCWIIQQDNARAVDKAIPSGAAARPCHNKLTQAQLQIVQHSIGQLPNRPCLKVGYQGLGRLQPCLADSPAPVLLDRLQ